MGRKARQLVDWAAGWLDGWLVGRPTGWTAGWLDGWLVGRLASWTAGWKVGPCRESGQAGVYRLLRLVGGRG